MVEFALIFPVFMLVLAGLLDFGFMLHSRITVINAAREGARATVGMLESPYTIPTQAANRAVAVSGGLSASPTTVVTCIAGTGHPSCDFVSGAAQPDPLVGDSVRVAVTYTYHTFFPLLFGATIDLSSSVQMVLEDQ